MTFLLNQTLYKLCCNEGVLNRNMVNTRFSCEKRGVSEASLIMQGFQAREQVQHFECRRGLNFKGSVSSYNYVGYFGVVKSRYSFHVLWGKCGMNLPLGPKFPGVLPFQSAVIHVCLMSNEIFNENQARIKNLQKITY